MSQGKDFSNVKQYNGQAQAPARKSNMDALMALLAQNKKAIASALPKHLTPERICRVAVNTITKTPALARCNPATLAMAIIEASSLGLEIDGRGLAYLVPFGNEVQLIYGYKGLMDLAYRSGKVVSIMAEVVGKNDRFTVVFGLDPKLEHTPNLEDGRGDIIASYAVAFMKDGSKQFVVVSKADLDKIKNASKSKSGPWQTWPEEMAKKTAIKRLCKMLPLSPEIQRAATIDDQADAGVTQTFCESLDDAVIDIPITKPQPQEPNEEPQYEHGHDSDKAVEVEIEAENEDEEDVARPELIPPRKGKKPHEQEVDNSYSFECPATGDTVRESNCVKCKQRKGCPAFEVI